MIFTWILVIKTLLTIFPQIKIILIYFPWHDRFIKRPVTLFEIIMMILKIFISFWLWKILAFIFNVDTYFEGFRGKWFLATRQQKCCLLTIPVPLPQHTGRQFFSRFLAVRRVSQSDQQTRQNWSKPLLNLALETFCLSLLPPLPC